MKLGIRGTLLGTFSTEELIGLGLYQMRLEHLITGCWWASCKSHTLPGKCLRTAYPRKGGMLFCTFYEMLKLISASSINKQHKI